MLEVLGPRIHGLNSGVVCLDEGDMHLCFCRCHCSVVQLCPALGNSGDCSTPGFLVLYSLSCGLLKSMSIELVMLSNHLISNCDLAFLPT